MAKQKKFILQESEIPTQWYNIQADMPNKPMPPIHPATKQPLGVDDLAHIFPRECCVQELDTEHRWIDIPEEVLDKYKYYRSTSSGMSIQRCSVSSSCTQHSRGKMCARSSTPKGCFVAGWMGGMGLLGMSA